MKTDTDLNMDLHIKLFAYQMLILILGISSVGYAIFDLFTGSFFLAKYNVPACLVLGQIIDKISSDLEEELNTVSDDKHSL
jgi:hypothetical protein